MNKEDLKPFKMHPARVKELTGIDADLYVFTYNQINEVIASLNDWKPYPENKELVIRYQIYMVTLPDLTVHSCFGMSFDQLHVIAFCSPAPYQPENTAKLNDTTSEPLPDAYQPKQKVNNG